MIVYDARKLTKVYGDRAILGIDRLQLKAGKIYGLVGPNGAGKSTLLNIFGFLDQPSSGTLYFRGQRVNFQESILQPLRRQVVVLDQYPVMFTTSVYKNLEFGLKIRKTDTAKRERIIDEVLDLVDMRSFKHAPAQNLSGGETQRIALARALALSPKVFLCDEPTASVDAENQATVISILKRINETKNITIIFTTHDRQLASDLAAETVVLNNGHLVPKGYENTFHCKVEQALGRDVRCIINERFSFLTLDSRPNPSIQQCRVFIDPFKIDLHELDGSSVNGPSFKGRVIKLAAENSHIRATIDVGFLLTVLLSSDAYNRLRPAIGATVDLSLQPDAATLYS